MIMTSKYLCEDFQRDDVRERKTLFEKNSLHTRGGCVVGFHALEVTAQQGFPANKCSRNATLHPLSLPTTFLAVKSRKCICSNNHDSSLISPDPSPKMPNRLSLILDWEEHH